MTVNALNGFTASVNFTGCSNLPSESTCSFSSATVAPGQTMTLTVLTTAPSSLVPASRHTDFGRVAHHCRCHPSLALVLRAFHSGNAGAPPSLESRRSRFAVYTIDRERRMRRRGRQHRPHQLRHACRPKSDHLRGRDQRRHHAQFHLHPQRQLTTLRFCICFCNGCCSGALQCAICITATPDRASGTARRALLLTAQSSPHTPPPLPARP